VVVVPHKLLEVPQMDWVVGLVDQVVVLDQKELLAELEQQIKDTLVVLVMTAFS
jgi:hypothetical protein